MLSPQSEAQTLQLFFSMQRRQDLISYLMYPPLFVTFNCIVIYVSIYFSVSKYRVHSIYCYALYICILFQPTAECSYGKRNYSDSQIPAPMAQWLSYRVNGW